MGVVISRFEVHLVHLGPAQGMEVKMTRPCLVVSPDDMNRHLGTVIVAPMTTRLRGYPCRVTLQFQGQTGEIALDHVRSVDKQRLLKRLGRIDPRTGEQVLDVLSAMFAR